MNTEERIKAHQEAAAILQQIHALQAKYDKHMDGITADHVAPKQSPAGNYRRPQEIQTTPAPDNGFDVKAEKISADQLRKLFATLGGHGIKDEDTAKLVIKGYIKQHHGLELESTRDVPKGYAVGMIDEFENSTKDEILEKYEVPF